jgi:hypothetical protein
MTIPPVDIQAGIPSDVINTPFAFSELHDSLICGSVSMILAHIEAKLAIEGFIHP